MVNVSIARGTALIFSSELTYQVELVSSHLGFVQDEISKGRRLSLRAALLVKCSL